MRALFWLLPCCVSSTVLHPGVDEGSARQGLRGEHRHVPDIAGRRRLLTRTASTFEQLRHFMEVEDVVSLASDIPMRSALTVSKHLSISSETGAALDGQQAVQVIVVEDDGDLSLDNVAIKYGRSETMGGAVAVLGGTLELFRCGVFNSAVRQGGGGAIYVAQGTLHVIDSTFYDNSASTGGVISLDNSAMTMSGCTLRNNSAIIGGAIVARASTLDVVGSAFVKNTAEALGGAISIGLRSRLVATSCHFADNEARSSARNETVSRGGAIYLSDSAATVSSTEFASNNADEGGAIALFFSSVITMTTNALRHNAAQRGGAIAVDESRFTDTGSDVRENVANDMGGGVYVVSHGSITTARGRVRDNVPDDVNVSETSSYQWNDIPTIDESAPRQRQLRLANLSQSPTPESPVPSTTIAPVGLDPSDGTDTVNSQSEAPSYNTPQPSPIDDRLNGGPDTDNYLSAAPSYATLQPSTVDSSTGNGPKTNDFPSPSPIYATPIPTQASSLF